MRIASLSGRLVIVDDDRALDVEQASSGAFSSDPQSVYARWEKSADWAKTQDASSDGSFEPAALGAAVPLPPQVFAIGLNYTLSRR